MFITDNLKDTVRKNTFKTEREIGRTSREQLYACMVSIRRIEQKRLDDKVEAQERLDDLEEEKIGERRESVRLKNT